MLTEKELEEIRRKLLELEEEPPAEGWQNIRARVRPRRRWRLGWWLLPLGLLLTTAGGLLLHVENPERPVAARTTGAAAKPRAGNLPEAPVPAAPGKAAPAAPAEVAPADPAKAVPADLTRAVPADPPKARPGASPLPAGPVAGNRPPSGTGAHPGDAGERSRPAEDRPGDRQSRRQPAPAGKAPMARTTKRRPGGLAGVSGTEMDTRAVKPPTGETGAAPNGPESAVARPAALTPLRSRPVATGPWRVTSRQISLNVPAAHPADSAGRAPADEKIRAKEPGTARGWTIGAFAAPRYSFRRFAPEGSDDVYITRLNNRNASDPQRMGYEAGLMLGRSVTPRLTLRTSLAYTRLNENLSYAYTTGRVDTVLRSLTGDGEILVNPVLQTGERQLISSYAYAGWRAGATWYFAQRPRRRYHLSFDGGVNLLVKGKTKTLLNGESRKTAYFPSRDNLLEQTNYNLQVGVGCSFRAGRGYEFTVMPALNYFLGSTFRNREPFGLRPYSLGVHLQLSRRLGQ